MIICSNEEEERSHIISKLHSHRRPFAQIYDTDQCQHYLKAHFTGQVESLSSFPSQMQLVTASEVDYERYVPKYSDFNAICGTTIIMLYCLIVVIILYVRSSCVRVVTSLRSGMGKSLYIHRMVEQLQAKIRGVGKACVTVPLHGPKVTPDVVVDYLVKNKRESACTIFHVDVAPAVCDDE